MSATSMNWQFRCLNCGNLYPAEEALWQCTTCSGELTIDYADPKPSAANHTGTGLWQFVHQLPVDDPVNGTYLGEGNTPLVPVEIDGHTIFLKMDSQLPTGSFKDRGAAVLAHYLQQIGVTRIIIDSSGNAASAMAAYAAATGLDCTVYVPANASPGKLVQARATGATVVPVEGSREDVATAAQRASAADRTASYASHNWHPVFVEGVKTWALETIHQLDNRTPDWMFVPTGGGSAFVGAWRAFAGSSIPRLAACQPSACDPVVRAWDAGNPIERVEAGSTIAEGTKIALPSRPRQIQQALKESNGVALSIEESFLKETLLLLWGKGIFVEPTGALGVAGCRMGIASGQIKKSETVVAHITGHGLKSTPIAQELLQGV